MKIVRTEGALALWGSEMAFGEGESRSWRLGGTRLWVVRRSGEWRVAFAESPPGRVPPAGEPNGRDGARPRGRKGGGAATGASGPDPALAGGTPEAPPSDLIWLRFFAGGGTELTLLPALPDRPVVIRPRSPVAILPGRSARFYIRIPAWVSLFEGKGGRRQLIAQHHLVRLSNTWFGTPDNGELCYASASPLAISSDEEAPTPFTVVCPIAIRNESSDALDFQRICLRVQYLSLYLGASCLATNEVVFHFRGHDQSSQITFREEPPDFEPGFKRIAEPRLSPVKGLIQKSFEYIRALAT